MIFVTVGTHEDRFDRLLDAAAALTGAGEEVLIQTGPGPAVPGARCVGYLSYDEMLATMSEARVVVSHAGVGSVLTALRCRRRPIIMPRRGDRGEHVDEHQSELASRLEDAGLARVVNDAEELRAAALAPGSRRAPALQRPQLVDELGSYIAEVAGC